MQSAPPAPDTRLRQNALLASLGAAALRAEHLDDLLQEACRLIASGLDVRFSKVLEYRPALGDLLVRAGFGWHPGVVGHATLSADDGSPAGHALRTNQPVISNDLPNEPRFRTPQLLLDHGVRRAMNVIIRGDGAPFGVLEVDCRDPGSFLQDDVSFMQGAANLLGVAVERARREAELRRALDLNETLLRAADHRIKNSLQLVASLLGLQRARLTDAGAVTALDDAILRVRAVAEAHRALHVSRDLRTIGLSDMLAELCRHLGTLSRRVTVSCQTRDDLELDAERALPLGMIVNELVTKAIRDAYPDDAEGAIRVSAFAQGDELVITCADDGIVPPPAVGAARSLGASIAAALVRQIGAKLDVAEQPERGSIVTLRVALHRPA